MLQFPQPLWLFGISIVFQRFWPSICSRRARFRARIGFFFTLYASSVALIFFHLFLWYHEFVFQHDFLLPVGFAKNIIAFDPNTCGSNPGFFLDSCISPLDLTFNDHWFRFGAILEAICEFRNFESEIPSPALLATVSIKCAI